MQLSVRYYAPRRGKPGTLTGFKLKFQDGGDRISLIVFEIIKISFSRYWQQSEELVRLLLSKFTVVSPCFRLFPIGEKTA
jgi:hypothetical protein